MRADRDKCQACWLCSDWGCALVVVLGTLSRRSVTCSWFYLRPFSKSTKPSWSTCTSLHMVGCSIERWIQMFCPWGVLCIFRDRNVGKKNTFPWKPIHAIQIRFFRHNWLNLRSLISAKKKSRQFLLQFKVFVHHLSTRTTQSHGTATELKENFYISIKEMCFSYQDRHDPLVVMRWPTIYMLLHV